ncbi:peptidylprolyl isomerase [Myxococcota bacterium]|nr:peptidylprolyl isomerase [Myxococcota bacterium]
MIRVFTAALGCLSWALVAAADDSLQSVPVAEGRVVVFDYTLRLEDGTVHDTSVGRQPMRITHGARQIELPGLESALLGMRANESKKVVLGPEEAYGNPSPAKLQKVPLAQIPAENRNPGEVIVAQPPEGPAMYVTVLEVREEVVIVDFNHPLAGRTVTFEIEVVSVE